ncbi:MAG: hypothetical protein KAS04_02005, partial [Candidatus Aenigmarchaeota archaeon]|nr:hypothetical protein [Candidatus Aenigmarchaeota archaeon]
METLHKESVAQVEFLNDSYLDEKKLERDQPPERVTEISKLLLRLRKIIDLLSRFEPKVDKNLIEDILSVDRTEKTKSEHLTYEQAIKRAEKVLEKCEDRIDEISKRLYEIESKRTGLSDKIRSYEKFEELNFNLDHLEESGYVHTIIGMMPHTELLEFQKKMKEKFGKEFVFVEGASFSTKKSVSICVMKNRREDLDAIIREFGFERMRIEGTGNIKHIVANLRGELKDIGAEHKDLETELKGFYDKDYREFLITEEILDIEKERNEIFISCGKTQKTVHMRLWAVKEDFEKVENLVKKETNNVYVMDEDLDPEDAPIKLKNPKIFQPFEGLIKLFALPKYNEIDPTVLMAPTFCLFFGIMLTDAMYGLFLIIAGAVIWKTLSKYTDSAKSGGIIIIGCGIAAIFFGVLTGSYFGDMFAVDLFNSTPQEIAIFMDPMYGSNAMTFLLIFMAMGFVHLFAGYFFGAYDSIRRGDKKKALTHYIAWYVFVGGLGIAALTFFPAEAPLLPEFFVYIGAVVALAGF